MQISQKTYIYMKPIVYYVGPKTGISSSTADATASVKHCLKRLASLSTKQNASIYGGFPILNRHVFLSPFVTSREYGNSISTKEKDYLHINCLPV